jgi:hypothetical protein
MVTTEYLKKNGWEELSPNYWKKGKYVYNSNMRLLGIHGNAAPTVDISSVSELEAWVKIWISPHPLWLRIVFRVLAFIPVFLVLLIACTRTLLDKSWLFLKHGGEFLVFYKERRKP